MKTGSHHIHACGRRSAPQKPSGSCPPTVTTAAASNTAPLLQDFPGTFWCDICVLGLPPPPEKAAGSDASVRACRIQALNHRSNAVLPWQ